MIRVTQLCNRTKQIRLQSEPEEILYKNAGDAGTHCHKGWVNSASLEAPKRLEDLSQVIVREIPAF